MYPSRKEFNSHGYTDGCKRCRDLASGKQRAGSFLSPHNVACRRRMETAIKTADPDRWARYLLRRGQEVEAEGEEPAGHQRGNVALPALEDGRAEDEDDDDVWGELFEGLDRDEGDSGPSGSGGSPSAPLTRSQNQTSIPLRKLMEYKNKKGEISAILAWDDLTHMKLDAG